VIPKDGIKLAYIQAALERRFWYVVLPFFVISLAVLIYLIMTPRSYRAETVILIEPQKVPGEFVSPTVTVDLTARLRTITQQIKSRTRLEKIIQQYGLYEDMLADATMTDAVDVFRDNIEVNVRGGHHAFEVSFQGKDRVKVRDVTNTLANLFIESNLKLREAQATGTTKFLDREIERLESDLQAKEEARRQFKEKYRGVLPENMNQNTTMMSHLQKQLDSINATIEQTKDRNVMLDTQLKNLERMEAQFASFEVGAGDMLETTDQASGTPEAWTSPELDQLRAELNNLKTRYSDKHPDVIKLQARIARLEEKQEAPPPEDDSEELVSVPDSGAVGVLEGASLFEAQEEDMRAQLRLIAGELGDLLQERNKIKAEIEMYRQRIEMGPKIELMWTDLSRGYDSIRNNYNVLLDKKYKAKVAENLERAQQAEQFTVLDPAKLPDKPFKPKTRKILMLAFFLALGSGFGLALLQEYLDASFSSAKELENRLQMPVLVSIPFIMTDRDRRRILVKKIATGTAMASMASILLYALYFLWKMDPMLHTSPLG
jgi:polysaccharide chain length determinant protein (PEP-CTERM system associated)